MWIGLKEHYFFRKSEFHAACTTIFTRIKYNDQILSRYCRAIRWIWRFIHSRWAIFYEAQPSMHSRTNDDIDMKLGLVTKRDKRNKTISKKLEDGVMSTNYDVILILPIYGKFGAIRKPNSRRIIVYKIYNFINRNLLSYKNWN